MSQIPERSARFMAAFRERILVLDGAMGTMIQARNLTAEDFGGAAAARAATRTSTSPART